MRLFLYGLQNYIMNFHVEQTIQEKAMYKILYLTLFSDESKIIL